MGTLLLFIAYKINHLHHISRKLSDLVVYLHEAKIHYQRISILLIKTHAIHIYSQICELLQSSKKKKKQAEVICESLPHAKPSSLYAQTHWAHKKTKGNNESKRDGDDPSSPKS